MPGRIRSPDLRASDQSRRFQHELASTEDRIQLTRRIYNANVRDLNTLVESVPSRFVASAGGFGRAVYFEVDPIVAGPPAVDLG